MNTTQVLEAWKLYLNQYSFPTRESSLDRCLARIHNIFSKPACELHGHGNEVHSQDVARVEQFISTRDRLPMVPTISSEIRHRVFILITFEHLTDYRVEMYITPRCDGCLI